MCLLPKKKEKAFRRPFYSVSPSLATSLGMIKKGRLLQRRTIRLWHYFISSMFGQNKVFSVYFKNEMNADTNIALYFLNITLLLSEASTIFRRFSWQIGHAREVLNDEDFWMKRWEVPLYCRVYCLQVICGTFRHQTVCKWAWWGIACMHAFYRLERSRLAIRNCYFRHISLLLFLLFLLLLPLRRIQSFDFVHGRERRNFLRAFDFSRFFGRLWDTTKVEALTPVFCVLLPLLASGCRQGDQERLSEIVSTHGDGLGTACHCDNPDQQDRLRQSAWGENLATNLDPQCWYQLVTLTVTSRLDRNRTSSTLPNWQLRFQNIYSKSLLSAT
jgi:hypothetical protein